MKIDFGVKNLASMVAFVVSFSVFSGNPVYNSSFEKTTNPGMPDGFKSRWSHAQKMSSKTVDWRVVGDNPYDGAKCLRAAPGTQTQLFRMHLDKGKSVFSIYARASSENSKVSIVSVYGIFRGGTYSIGKKWRRLSLVIDSPKARNVSMLLRNKSKGAVWWDAAQMDKGETPSKYADDYHTLLDDVRANGKPKSTPRYKIVKTTTPPVIDGVLGDSCWNRAPKVVIPSLKDPRAGNTEIRMTYDDSNFYLGITCMEPYMRHIVGKRKNHDDLVYADDSLELFFDTENKQDGYRHFMLNCIGAQAEELVWRYNRQWLWNGVWTAKIIRGKDRWTAEIAIPFTTLGLKKGYSENWGVNICRSRAYAGEYLPWYGKYHAPETFPEVVGVKPDLVGAAVAGFSYRVDPKSGELIAEFMMRFANRPASQFTPVVLSSVDGGENLKPGKSSFISKNKGTEATVVRSSIPFPAKGGKAVFQVRLLDKRGAVVFVSDKRIVNLNRVVDGPGPNYELYLDGETARCLFDLSHFAVESHPELQLVLRDACDVERYRKTIKSESKMAKVDIPLSGLPFGKYQLTVSAAVGKLTARRTFWFRYLRKPEQAVVRSNRHSRTVEINGTPFIGFATSASTTMPIPEFTRTLAEYKAKGLNSVYLWNIGKRGLPEAPLKLEKYLDVAQKFGMKVYVDLSIFFKKKISSPEDRMRMFNYAEALLKHNRTHPALLTWDFIDEPDPSKVDPRYVQCLYRLTKQLDPYHPATLNVNCDAARIIPWLTVADIASIDYYPIMGGAQVGGVSYVAKSISKLAPYKPLRFWLETFTDLDNSRSPREPTPLEFKNMSYVAAIHGTTLFTYFTFKPNSPELYDEWKVVSRELSTISGALSANERYAPRITSDGNVDATIRVSKGEAVIIAANLDEDSCRASFALPKYLKLKSNTVKVLFENRTVKLENGVISDRFAKLARHVYVVKLK